MSYNTTIIEKIFRGHTMAVFANPPLPPLNGPLCLGRGLRGYLDRDADIIFNSHI